MRVLIATRQVDRSEAALYQGLQAAGMRIEVVCHPSADSPSDLAAAGIPLARLDVRHRLDRQAIRFLRRRMQEHRPAIVYAPDNAALAASCLAARRLPVRVVGYRGTTGHLHRLDPGSRLTYLNPRVDHIVCVSDAVRDYLREAMRIPASRLTTIYKGHDSAWYGGGEPVTLSEFGIPPTAFVVGFAGRLRPVKGGVFLLRAFEALASAMPQLHLLLIGDVSDRRVRRRLARLPSHARVHCTGYRTDAPRLLGACDVSVMPSIDREGLSRAVIEAMAQARPAIVTRVGGLPELVVHGETGRVVPPRDARALADAIRFFAEHPEHCRTYGLRARQRIDTVFTIQATIDRTRRLFHRLAG